MIECPKCEGKGYKLLRLEVDDPDAWEWCRLCHGDGVTSEHEAMVHELALMSEDS